MPPPFASGRIDERKIRRYLLSESHPDGRHKAAFFSAMGFQADGWQVLADALRIHASSARIRATVSTAYGVRYTLVGPMPTPSGRTPVVVSVWIDERGDETAGPPPLVTAYPE